MIVSITPACAIEISNVNTSKDVTCEDKTNELYEKVEYQNQNSKNILKPIKDDLEYIYKNQYGPSEYWEIIKKIVPCYLFILEIIIKI